MGRTLRRNLKNSQAAPYMIYMIRKWRAEVINSKVTVPVKKEMPKSWADWDDDDDDDELPFLCEWQGISTPEIPKEKYISVIPEYIYKNR